MVDYHAIFENVSDGLVIHDPDTGEILDVNERFCEMNGYAREEMLDLSIEDITADDWEPPMSPAERVRQARDEGRIRFEWCNQHRNGHRLWFEVTLSLIEFDGEERVLASVRDVTERKEHERRIDAIFDQTYQFTGLMEPDGTLIEANRTALDFGGLDREDVIGKPFWETYWWQVGEETKRELRAAIERAADGEFVRYEVEVQGDDDTVIVDFSIRPVTDEQGNVTLLIPEGRDITALKERERQLQQERERLEFVNRFIRHNMLTSLNVVQARTNLLDSHVDSGALAHVETIRAATAEMIDLIETLRSLTQTIVDEEFSPDHVDLDAVLREEVERARETYDNAEFEVEGDLDDAGPVLADDLLGEVFNSLLANAVRNNDSAVPRVTVDADVEDEEVTVRIADNGPGIAAEERERLFSDGSGLHLAHEILDLYGGTISLEDDSGTFSVTLPRA